MLAVTVMVSGTPGSANEWLGPRLSAPTIPYKPGYGSLQPGGGDHFVGAWLHGCSCRRPDTHSPGHFRRTSARLYANTSAIGNNASQPTQAIPPAPTQSNVASKCSFGFSFADLSRRNIWDSPFSATEGTTLFC